MRSPTRSLILIAILACDLFAGFDAMLRTSAEAKPAPPCGQPETYLPDMVFQPQYKGVDISTDGANVLVSEQTTSPEPKLLSGKLHLPSVRGDDQELIALHDSAVINFSSNPFPTMKKCPPIVLLQAKAKDAPCWYISDTTKKEYRWISYPNKMIKLIIPTKQGSGLVVIRTEYDINDKKCDPKIWSTSNNGSRTK